LFNQQHVFNIALEDAKAYNALQGFVTGKMWWKRLSKIITIYFKSKTLNHNLMFFFSP